MKHRLYDVEVQLDSNKNIETATCTCPGGQFLCHYMAAVYIHAHHNTSVTSVECKWSGRKAKEKRQVVTVQDIKPGRTHLTTRAGQSLSALCLQKCLKLSFKLFPIHVFGAC